jgi:hypothetical protein
LNTALDDAGAGGVTGKPGGVVEFELLHEMLTILLEGLDADTGFRRRSLIGAAFGNYLEHFHLALSQLD